MKSLTIDNDEIRIDGPSDAQMTYTTNYADRTMYYYTKSNPDCVNPSQNYKRIMEIGCTTSSNVGMLLTKNSDSMLYGTEQ